MWCDGRQPGNPAPVGPFEDLDQLVERLALSEYPADGYIVHFDGASGVSNVPALFNLPDSVVVLTIEHRHGFDTTVYRTAAGATAGLYKYVASQWDDEALRCNLGPMPATADEAIAAYFEGVEDEWYLMSESQIHEENG